MGLIGRIPGHTFFTFPENTDLSPWQPYHASRGFAATDSCVTVASVHGTGPLQHFYGGMIGTWTAEEILNRIVEDVQRRQRRSYPGWGSKGVGAIPGSGGPGLSEGTNYYYIVLFPELAAEYNRMGFNQKGLQDEVYKRTSVPYDELNEIEKKGIKAGIEIGLDPGRTQNSFRGGTEVGGDGAGADIAGGPAFLRRRRGAGLRVLLGLLPGTTL